MGNFLGFTDTQFVGTEELGAVSSYQPCIVFGDSMLIGMGIRIGFYLLYWAAIISVAFGIDQQFRIWNAAWSIVALGTFISLLLNSTSQTLVVLAWAILIELVLFYPVFFLLQIFLRAVYTVSSSQRRYTVEEVQARLSLGRAITQLDAARARRYADVLKAFALHAAEVHKEGEYEAAQAARLTQSIEIFSTRWSEHDVSIDARNHAAREQDFSGETDAVIYNPSLVAQQADAPTCQDVNAFRDAYVAALVRANLSAAEAQDLELQVAALAAEELQLRRRTIRPRHAIAHMLFGTAIKDKVAAALGLLVWSAWMYATPWLWFRIKNYGFKTECEGYVNLYVLFKPLDPWWDSGFGTFLKIFACGSIPVAVFTTLVAFWLLFASLFGHRRLFRKGRRRGGRGRGGDETDQVEEAAVLTVQGQYARRVHAEEVLATIHDRQTRGPEHRYRRRPPPQVHFALSNLPWIIVLLILIVYTIATVEMTIVQPHHYSVFFVRPNLHETAEILVFLIGALVFLMVIWSLLEAVVHFFFRRRGNTRSGRGSRWRKEEDPRRRESQQDLWAKTREGGDQPEP